MGILPKKNFDSLKEARKHNKKTQSDIAGNVGISESYYNLIENGKRVPTIMLSSKIASELGINLNEFFLLFNSTKCKDLNA